MTQFKIGDKVRVTDGPAADREYFANVRTGDEGEVRGISDHEDSLCSVSVDFGVARDGEWFMNERHLELVSSPSELTDQEIGLRINAAADLAEEKGMKVASATFTQLLLVFTIGNADDREVIRKLVCG